jgi:hypothetical protein
MHATVLPLLRRIVLGTRAQAKDLEALRLGEEWTDTRPRKALRLIISSHTSMPRRR